MVDILIPIARRMPISYGNRQKILSPSFRGNAVILRSKEEINLLSQIFGGRSARPRQEVIVVGPDGRTPILVAGLGVTEVSELEDVIYEGIERGEARIKKQGTQIPFAQIRERRGMPQANEFDTKFREALHDRIERHRRNPVSAPPRQPMNQFLKGAVTMPEKSWDNKSSGIAAEPTPK